MKKLLVLVCAAIVSISASAQKGDKAIGVNLSYGAKVKNIGLGVKGQYYLTDRLRGEASIDHFLKKDNVSMWDINANLHYLFDVAPKLQVYPVVGVGYTKWNVHFVLLDGKKKSASEDRLAVNLGCGVQYQLINRINVNAELKYQIIDNYNQLVPSVGLTYRL